MPTDELSVRRSNHRAPPEGAGSSRLPECIVALTAGNDQKPACGPAFFCATGAGGGVHQLATLASASALQKPFYGLETRALPDELRCDFSIQDTARHFLSAIREVQPVGPYFLGGYSLGGWIAIEIAHGLLDAGETVRPVIVIDAFAGPPAGLLWSLARRVATAPVGEWKDFLIDRLNRRLQKFRGLAKGSPEFAEMEFAVRNEMKVGLNYRSRDLMSCRVPLRVIVSRSPSRMAPKAPDRGWSSVAKSGFEFHEIPGDHHSMLQGRHVSELGARLKAFVDG
jgi:thioesterase domain-containing protein